LWGVYVFKRGFGGYAMRSLVTHDLVYQPLVYAAYRRMLDVKRWRDERRLRNQSGISKEEAKRDGQG
jgi:lipid II:glycine glycyltransferase (peptidoglycan interpeptide bridge formation enzyme)